MKKSIIVTLIIGLLSASLCACGTSQYEKELNSGMDKLKNGGTLTESEKKAANNFLEWQSKQNKQ